MELGLVLGVLIGLFLLFLMGEITFRCGFVDLLTRAIESFFGKLPGRTGLLTVGAGTFLAAVSGARIATSATLGVTLVPRMRSGVREVSKATFRMEPAGDDAAASILATAREVGASLIVIGIRHRTPVGKLCSVVCRRP